ncbi:nitrate reductase molybdenum cofactor assembly chaperone [Neobacillus niacini]|uniref:nitrate reductase molybdenum cofactor assembly chaperone n=1 Tax=Neobacillus niacini TaxID=86668 RepID=UPI002FFD718B
MEQMKNSMSSNVETEVRDLFKIISYLLQYPDKRWLQWGELVEEVQLLNNSFLKLPLLSFLDAIGGMSLEDLEQQYVSLFDFNPACSLSLSYLKAGEQKERGQILVELKAMYKDYGYEMTEEELSDYLPVLLEFSSVAPLQISVNLLRSFREPMIKLKNELEALKSPYHYLISACLSGMESLDRDILAGGRG